MLLCLQGAFNMQNQSIPAISFLLGDNQLTYIYNESSIYVRDTVSLIYLSKPSAKAAVLLYSSFSKKCILRLASFEKI